MAKFYETLSDELQSFIANQHLFFVATAPQEGRINLSPKGMDSFRCLDERQVAYLDLTGSGNETAAHLHENGRMTLMFCSFGEQPLILRLYGRGRPVRPGDLEWAALLPLFPQLTGARQIFVVQIESAQTSCGFAVPVYEFREERNLLLSWAENKGEEGLQQYWKDRNQTSIDGKPSGFEVKA